MSDEETKPQEDEGAETKPFEMLHEIEGVEIFRVGIWNGDKFSAKDLDDMVAAFDKVGFKPPVKLGHAEKSGGPAFGFVKAIRRAGDRLVADFMDIPSKLFELIKNRRFDSVSSEIFFNLDRNGTKFRRALKAVALLGAEIPAVADLKPLRDVVFEKIEGGDRVVAYSVSDFKKAKEAKRMSKDKGLTLEQRRDALKAELAEASEAEDATKVIELTADLTAVYEEITAAEAKAKDEAEAKLAKAAEDARSRDGDALDVKRLTERLAEQEKQISELAETRRQENIDAKVSKCTIPAIRDHARACYELAFAANADAKTVRFAVNGEAESDIDPVRLMDDLFERIDKFSEKLFTEHGEAGDLRRDDDPVTEDPGQTVDKRVTEYQAKNPKASYEDAMEAVFADDPALKRAYAQS